MTHASAACVTFHTGDRLGRADTSHAGVARGADVSIITRGTIIDGLRGAHPFLWGTDMLLAIGVFQRRANGHRLR